MADGDNEQVERETQHTISYGSLLPIYERLNAIPNYHPLDADTFADWSVDAGDKVTVTRDGTSYTSPIHAQRITWRKGAQVQLSSTGNKERPSLAKMSQMKYEGKSAAGNATGGGGGYGSSRYLHWYVQDKYGQMQSGLELTGSTARLYVEDKYREMSSGLALTSSSAALYVEDKYREMSAGLALTSSSAALYVEDRYREMSSGLELTSSSISAYVNDKYSEMSSGLELTSSSITAYVNDQYTQMSSGLALTSSSAALYVNNRYTEMSAGLALTSSSLAVYVNDKYTEMTSGLNVTSSTLHAFVENKYTEMKSGLALTMNSAYMYAKSAECAAEIFTEANKDGSNIRLNADHVYITGTTLLSGKVTIDDTEHFFKVKDSMYVDGSIYLYTSGSYIKAPDFRTTADGFIRIYGNTASQSRDLTYSSVGNFLNYANASGNTLTIRNMNGDTVNFSKAITHTTSWSSGHMTVTGQMKNTNTTTGLLETKNVYTVDQYLFVSDIKEDYSNNGTWYVPIIAKSDPNSQSYTATGCRVYVDASAIRTAGKNSVILSPNGITWTYAESTVENSNIGSNTASCYTSGRSPEDHKEETIMLDEDSNWVSGRKYVYIKRSSTGEYVCMGYMYLPTVSDSEMHFRYEYPNSYTVKVTGYCDQGGEDPETIFLQEASGRIRARTAYTLLGSTAMTGGGEVHVRPHYDNEGVTFWYKGVQGSYWWWETSTLPPGIYTNGQEITVHFDR